MGDEMLKKKKLADMILTYEDRVKDVIYFLTLIKPSLKINIFELIDPFHFPNLFSFFFFKFSHKIFNYFLNRF